MTVKKNTKYVKTFCSSEYKLHISNSEMRLSIKVFLVVIVLVTVTLWIQWSSNKEAESFILLQNILREHDYSIRPSKDICQKKPLFIIIVTSYVGHVELRSAHRLAITEQQLLVSNVVRVFLLAQIPVSENSISQRAIEDEHEIYGDILQGNFLENYKNLTRKHLMGLQWAADFCGEASYILKVDDDTAYNYKKTYDFILNLYKNLQHRDNFLVGYMLNNTKPRRQNQNKWYVTKEEYSSDVYPPYLSGWYYITTPSTANLLCAEASFRNPFWIDDIFITGILAKALHIRLEQLPQHFWLEYYELLECCIRDMVIKNLKCNHVVGPNGNRNNLIVEFNNIYNNCTNRCKERTKSQDLKKSCVVSNDREIFGTGQPLVKPIIL